MLLAAIAVVTVALPPLLAPSTDDAAPPGAEATRVPAPFARTTVEAEDEGNEVSAGAGRADCAGCHGGGRVRYLGGAARLTVRVPVDLSGMRTITVIYETDGWRTLKIDLNGTLVLERELGGAGWEVPREFRFTAVMEAGTAVLTFYNDESPAPDIDAITVE